MHPTLAHDLETLLDIASAAQAIALEFLRNVEAVPPARTPSKAPDAIAATDASVGIGAEGALDLFRTQWLPHLAGSAGPRTPASLVGDWLTSTVDQNPTSNWDSEAPSLERETVSSLANWFRLPSHTACPTLCRARSALEHLQRDVHAGPWPVMRSRRSELAGREAIDVDALDAALTEACHGTSCIVVASAGTVNTGDFDDLVDISRLKKKHLFWLHVDGTFGAGLDPRARMDETDSVCNRLP
ncbi:hypothetical protein H257_08178 [Aphanomyces astaci]|uniref:Uncharacterized protein n=1 Tax=Aphanomyces astaci TaxID=112090 RepID=W4GF88_APHAT|nr:hypothetical protein H257_08178 [Aphanomyces astaci]ETV77936.1 hypothetical protein H257_08178 [Aphanomyces astaci]|eukprot:XP_009832273.1 hypothetical protein H257_08178 [Aphanomyces astaci]